MKRYNRDQLAARVARDISERAYVNLAIGARHVYVMMDHTTKSGESKIVKKCTYPLTGIACVDRIYTDLAVIDVTREGLEVIEMVEGLSFEELQRMTGAPLAMARHAL